MSELSSSVTWDPVVSLNLMTATSRNFVDVEQRFAAWVKTQEIGPLDAKTGWIEITPPMAERWLQRNAKNRKANFATIEGYAIQIVNGQWKRTGQPIIFTDAGMLLDGQHRLWAIYLSSRSAWSYVLTDVPHEEDLFAFVDNSRPRTAADALHIVGVNGLANRLTAIVKNIAWRWDQGLMRIRGAVPMPKPSNREVMGYVQEHPDLLRAVKLLETNHKTAVRRLDDPVVAGFLAWKIIELHGEDALDRFMNGLIAKESSESDPLGLLQRRLERHERAKTASRRSSAAKDRLTQTDILAISIKAFNGMIRGQPMRPSGLNLVLDENFPTLVEPMLEAEAAE